MNNLITFFRKIHNSFSGKENANYILSFEQYLDSGKRKFTHKVVLFGEEKEKEYDELTIFRFVKSFYISKSILKFNDESCYTCLLKGFLIHIYYQIALMKKDKFAPAMLGTDLSLIFMLTLTYFPEENEFIGDQLVRFLKYHEEEKANSNRSITGDFGLSSTVLLSSFLADYHKNGKISKRIKSFCNKNMEPSYQKAIDNLFSEDQFVVNDWINEMVDFHIKNSTGDLTLPFNHEEWQYYPIEIISLLELRLKRGLEINFIENKFLKKFILHLGIRPPVKLDAFMVKLKDRVVMA